MLISACNNKRVADTQSIGIDVRKENDRLSDIFDSYEAIPLELSAPGDNIIGNIDKVIMRDGKIYVMDKSRMTVFIFTEDGKYLNKISRRGSRNISTSKTSMFTTG